MKSSLWTLGIIVTALFGILLLVTFQTPKNKIIYSGEEMVEKLKTSNYRIGLKALEKLKPYQVISLDDASFEKLDPTATMQLSIADLLSDDAKEFFNKENAKIIVSNNSIQAHEAWMLMTQLGYQEIYVLEEI